MQVFQQTTLRSQQNDLRCCGSPIFGEDQGFTICRNCGSVFDPVYENSPRRAFTFEIGRASCRERV